MEGEGSMKKYLTLIFFAALGSASAQWQQSSTGNTAGVTHCFIENSGVLLSGGNDLGIFSSTNNGTNWTASNTGIVPGDEILCFGKNSAGIFAGSDSLIYFSANNGVSWSVVNNSGNSVFALVFLSDTVYAATMGGGVIMSTNNGSTWSAVNSGITNTSVRSIAKKGTLLFAGTIGSGVFVSANSGASWSQLITSPTTIRSLETDGNNIYAGTPGSGMYVSSNDGVTWTQVTNGISPTNWIISAKRIGNALLTGLGMSGVSRSIDNGVSWTTFMTGLPTPGTFGAGSFYETALYVFCGIEGGGMGSVFRIDKNQVIAGIEAGGENISFIVFPNPTSQNATLEFSNPEKENFTFTLFDAKGDLVRTIFNIATGEIEIEKQNLASGLYFFLLQSDRKAGSGKLIIE